MGYQRVGMGAAVPVLPLLSLTRAYTRGIARRPVSAGNWIPVSKPNPRAPAYGRNRFADGLEGLGFDYSAITDCSMLTAFQRSQAPQCGGSAPVISGSGYVAPTLATPLSCIDPASGYASTDPACVNQNLQIQAANQSLLDAANRAVFLKNCHDMIYQENLSRAARGVPLQVDDCDSRTFGQVGPGQTGSYVPAPAPAPVTVATVAPASTSAPTAVAARGGSVSFANTSGGSNAVLKVGDRWGVSIVGASPNTDVAVRGGQNGKNDLMAMGRTDSAGNFSVSGQVTADQIGTWQETWLVGSATAGSFSFSVAAAPAQSGGGGYVAPGAPAGAPAGSFDIGATLSHITEGGFPWWGWAIAAAGGALLFGGRR